jgi:CheY-like chemotaxis protein
MAAKIKVLCVDDERDVADSTAKLLEMIGCQVRVAYSGATALNVAKEFCPDVCLIDLLMPGMTGQELAVKLREQAQGRPLRCIALTGRWDIDSHHETHNIDFEDHLVKPFNSKHLAEVVLGNVLPSNT